MRYNSLLESLNDYQNLVLNQKNPTVLKEAHTEVDLVNMIVGACGNDMETLRKGLAKISKQALRKLYSGCIDVPVKNEEDENCDEECQEESEENANSDDTNYSVEQPVEYDENGNPNR